MTKKRDESRRKFIGKCKINKSSLPSKITAGITETLDETTIAN